jgi:hypothetical protein
VDSGYRLRPRHQPRRTARRLCGQPGQAAPVTKEAVAAKLTSFTDDELAALGLSRKPQRGSRK